MYIMILTDSEETFREEQFLALETLHWSEGSTWLGFGRDLRQVGTGTWLDSNIPAVSRAHVWTNSFTVAAHIQKRRTVAQRRALPSSGDSDAWRSLQPRKAICAEIARHGR